RYDRLASDRAGITVSEGNRLIVVAPAAVAAGTPLFTRIAQDLHQRTFDELLRLPGVIPGARVAIKPHPRCDEFAFYDELQRRGTPGVEFLDRGVSLHALLPQAGLVILPNTPTDAALEAIVFGVPVLFISAAWQDAFDSGFNGPEEASMQAMVVRDLDRIASTVQAVLDGGETRDRVVAANAELLRHWAGTLDGGAVRRSAERIMATLESSPRR
ncbi:MAG TPA: hypothetical protein VF111_10830, partial [Thermoanaerobaculia bacterium]